MPSGNRRDFLKTSGLSVAGSALAALGSRARAAQASAARPNIVFILADDIGYGDLGCYGATKVRTPNTDRLAKEGIRFTNAYASASVCSPTRYSLLTGQYAWRNPAGDHILSGEESLAIDTRQMTVASLLKRSGYTTAVVGKWHVGLGNNDLDWNKEIAPGPLEVGFDYAFYYPATNDRVPCVYVENHRVVGLDPADPLRVSYSGKIGNEPTATDHPELLKLKTVGGHDGTIVDGISRIGYMSGGKSAWWTDEDMADTLTRKAVAFMEQNRHHPFFLYFATNNIHPPRVTHPRFKGTSGCGIRCDDIQEFDGCVGAVLATLDRLKLRDNTLLIVSSDNGGEYMNGYETYDVRDANGHLCNGPLRGYKGSVLEGGTREPFIARWPAQIKAGSQSDELLCLIDMLATCAAITGQTLPAEAGPDSFNLLPALLGREHKQPLRDHLVTQIGGGDPLAIRKGAWKLIPAGRAGPKSGVTNVPQLYDLSVDPGEANNLAPQHPELVKELSELLAQVRTRGRSRP
jgi:arylsulfatase A-like enzyme